MPGSRMPEGLELARLWHGVVGLLEVEVPGPTFTTWIEGTRPVRVDGETLVVEARSAFTCDSLNTNPLRTMVIRALRATPGTPEDIRFVPPAGNMPQPPAQKTAPDQSAHRLGTLNQRFTFTRYVCCEGNAVALRACRDIVENDDMAISPVVIHGQPGLGKTHLLHSIGAAAASEGRAIACLSAEEFANRYGAAVRDKRVEAFQAEMRALRLLLLDDLQYLENRQGTQVELVHTMEAIANGGGHVVVASEEDPRKLNLLPRLVSRLTGGLVARVEAPRGEERRQFVEHIAQQQRAALPGWCIDRLAALPAPSVRVIQGAVNAAVALQRTERLTLDALDASVLARSLQDACELRDAQAVIDAVARHFSVSAAEMAGRSRKPALTEARAVAVAALRERGETFTTIGNHLGARSNATLKDLNKRGARLIAGDAVLRRALAG